ncbi:hypothetical protein RVR_6747 [Actinacidiphila reveromycinica]|uniref:Heparinase II/III-like protein n=1 Tax=Actinacidiphila reveromycinica TaxID=659352 RepID=A0A7U3UWI9_9ACTN|nr:heparinase II/III family protein [Streptomyces sp. SN-593]BBA99916.1 hypothetical protein RVR_6747 [Streptomyces sp. SN-593]
MHSSETSFRSLLTPDVRAAVRVGGWSPAPPVQDRAAWAAVDEHDRHALHAELLRWRERAANEPHSLSRWAAYSRTGDRVPQERAEHALCGLVGTTALMLGVTGDDELVPRLADGVWRMCELSAWCLPSHYALPESGERPFLPVPGRDVLDLADASIGAMLAGIDAIAGERLEQDYPGLRARVHHEIRRRVLDPWENEVYFWHGVDGPPNNWAPWIVSNVLVCAAVVETDKERLTATVDRALVILDRFRAGYDDDGSCDEGATYWWWAGATLFEALDLLEELTAGTLNGFPVAPVPQMARFPMSMQIGTGSQVNYSDGSPVLPENANWHLLARFGARVGDEEVVRHARWMGRTHPLRFDGQLAPLFRRTLTALRAPGWADGEAAPGMPAALYLPGTEVAVARERAGGIEGLFVAAKGGHNDVSHNHNDAGGVIVALDGDPVLIDAGVGVYRRETFEPATRYTIWTMRSGWHNVPLPNGVEQPHGAEYRATGTAFDDDGTTTRLEMDLTAAYPPESGLLRCGRTVLLDRRDPAVEIRDTWAFGKDGTMTLVLMTALEPEPEEGGLRVGAAHVAVDTAGFEVVVESIDLDDAKLARAWNGRVFRTRLVQRVPAPAGGHVLRVTRAATS